MYSDIEVGPSHYDGNVRLSGAILGRDFSLKWDMDTNSWKPGTFVSATLSVKDFENHIIYLTEYVKLAKMGYEQAQQYLLTQKELGNEPKA